MDGRRASMEWGIGLLPYNEAQPADWSGGFSLSIPTGAKNAEAAWEFIKCMTGAEGQASWARDTQAQPTQSDAAKDPVLRPTRCGRSSTRRSRSAPAASRDEVPELERADRAALGEGLDRRADRPAGSRRSPTRLSRTLSSRHVERRTNLDAYARPDRDLPEQGSLAARKTPSGRPTMIEERAAMSTTPLRASSAAAAGRPRRS